MFGRGGGGGAGGGSGGGSDASLGASGASVRMLCFFLFFDSTSDYIPLMLSEPVERLCSYLGGSIR